MTMEKKVKVIHYLNQFFAGIGGEEQAGVAPKLFHGSRGPGQFLERAAPEFEVVVTVTAGDNYMAENLNEGTGELLSLIERSIEVDKNLQPDLLIAGPAFNAGRYGMACAAVCRAVQRRFDIPALTALYPENPAVENYRGDVTIVRAADSVLGMQDAIRDMIQVARKLMRGDQIVPSEDKTIPHGLRQNYFAQSTGASRALEMLMKKVSGDPFETEYVMPSFDRVSPAPAVDNLRSATIALVTTGGIVPRGNPDRIESANASKFGGYSIAGLDVLTSDTHQSVHGGYDTTYANADPNRVLPLDVLRELESEGRFGRLHHTYYATVGNATSVQQAVRYGKEIAASLVNEGVQAVILTST
jgi:glycine reductase